MSDSIAVMKKMQNLNFQYNVLSNQYNNIIAQLEYIKPQATNNVVVSRQIVSLNKKMKKIETNLRLEGHHHLYEFYDNRIVQLPALSYINGTTNLGFVKLETNGNEFILDVFKGLNKNNVLEHYDQKILKKICK